MLALQFWQLQIPLNRNGIRIKQSLRIFNFLIPCCLGKQSTIYITILYCRLRFVIISEILLNFNKLFRFDLIFLILDPQDEHFDRRLATHLVSLYHHSEFEEQQEKHIVCSALNYDHYIRIFNLFFKKNICWRIY